MRSTCKATDHCDGGHGNGRVHQEGFVLYFLPTLVAVLREKYDKVSIFLLNFFLGWSLIGWIVALVWACKNDRIVYVQNVQRN
jgi:hypothetical protein